jgi:hypothetical protein
VHSFAYCRWTKGMYFFIIIFFLKDGNSRFWLEVEKIRWCSKWSTWHQFRNDQSGRRIQNGF